MHAGGSCRGQDSAGLGCGEDVSLLGVAGSGGDDAVRLAGCKGSVRYLRATRMFHAYIRDSQRFGRFRGVFAGFRGFFAGFSRGFRGGFAGVSRGFRGGFAGVSRGFRGRFAQFASLQIDSYGSRTLHLQHKVTQNSHPFHTFRTTFARFPKEFSPSFAAVSQPFHSRFTSLREISQL